MLYVIPAKGHDQNLMKEFSKFEKWEARRRYRLAERCQLADLMKRTLQEKGKPVFQKYGVRKVVLFGSVADNRCRAGSDLDILVMPLPNQSYWELRHELKEAIGLPVDLYTQDDDPIFVKKVLERGVVIYEV